MNNTDRIKASLQAFIQTVLPRQAYYGRYGAVVVVQNADGTLELKPDSTKVPPLSNVPYRTGVPGFEFKVAPGSRCLVAFEGGDPSRPFVDMWEPGAFLLEVKIGGVLALFPVIKGPLYNTAVATWQGALSTYLAAMVPLIPGGTAALTAPTIAYNAAVAAFTAAATASLSLVTKTE